MTTTTINTGTYLLAILQDDYNHHQRLADSYEKMASECDENDKERKSELLENYKKHNDQAVAIYCQVNLLDSMEKNDRAHIEALRQNYRVYKAMYEAKGE